MRCLRAALGDTSPKRSSVTLNLGLGTVPTFHLLSGAGDPTVFGNFRAPDVLLEAVARNVR